MSNRKGGFGLTGDEIAELKEYLASFDLFAGIEAEGTGYLNNSLRRFLITLETMPPAVGPDEQILELGANPYFLSLMLMRYRRCQVTAANYFGEGGPAEGQGEQHITSTRYGEEYRFVYQHFNVEQEPFPYADDRFDGVLCCEILEHLALDPTRMLYEIHRVLKPGGYLLLTTPNVLAFQNLQKIATGHNIYDQYSGYGVYGRHNREYAPLELIRLLHACGFEVARIRLEDIYPHPLGIRLLKRVRTHWRDNIFLLARTAGPARYGYPPFLYRSLHQLRHVTSSRLVMGVNDTPQLGTGWYALEQVPYPARWTGRRAVAYLLSEGQARFLNCELDPLAASLGPVTLSLEAGAARHAVRFDGDGRQTVQMDLPPGLAGEIEVCLTLDPLRNPARLGFNADTRDLGVLVNQIWLD